jgi:hypothetical protein
MRLWRIICAILLLSCSAPAALLSHTSGGGASNITSSPIATTGATLLVVTVNTYAGAGVTLTDSQNNSWTLAVNILNGVDANVSIYYAWIQLSPSVSHTITLHGSGTYAAFTFAAYSKTRTSADPLDQTGSASSSFNAQTLQLSGITPTENGELIVTSLAGGQNSATPFNIDSGFLSADQIGYTGGAHVANASAFLVQGSAGLVNPVWSWSVNGSLAGAVIASFKRAVPSGGAQWFIF